MAEAADDGGQFQLRFPCDLPIKVMGRAAPEFEAIVVGIVRRHAPDLGEDAVSSRASSGGRYLALTLRVRARSRAQLDAIYRELSAHPDVLVSL